MKRNFIAMSADVITTNPIIKNLKDEPSTTLTMTEKPRPPEAILPLEILIYIFEHLTSSADLNALAQTNRTFYSLLNDRLYTHDAKNSKAWALRWAASHDMTSTAQRSIAAGADLHCPAYTDTRIGACPPLALAAYNGGINILQILLANESIDPTIRDSRVHRTPLHWAVLGKHSSVVRALLKDARIDVNSQDKWGATALILAVEEYPEVIPLLLQRGHADPRIGNRTGDTALSRAVAENREETDLLLAAHVQFLLDGDDSAWHCQYIFRYAALTGSMDVLRYMVEYFGEKKLDPNEAEGDYGRGPFSCAAERNQVEVVRYLCKWEKTNPNLSDGWQHNTPLFSAALSNRVEIVKALLECDRVDLELSNVHGTTPLGVAAATNHDEIVALLLSGSGSRRADPNAKNADSHTSLYLAAMFGHLQVVEALLNAEGIDPTLGEESEGITPLDIAKERGYDDVVERLQCFIKDHGDRDSNVVR